MRTTLEELRQKEVVNLEDGCCFGFVDDVMIDTETRKVFAVTVRKKTGIFGFFGRGEELSVSWDEIETIGKDIVLVKTKAKFKSFERKENIFQKILDIFL